AIIESHLIPHVYDCIQKHHPDDVIMKHQYLELRSKSQKDLGIQACYIDHSLVPYHDAISKLREISLVKLPTQKLRSIILASQNAVKRMNELCSDEEVVAGADEFIDIWVYITIQASVPDLCWDIQYLKAFSNPNYMLSETGYYLSSLEMAAEYIKRLDSMDSLDSGVIESTPDQPTYLLLPDVNVARTLCERDGRLFKLVDEEYVLEGYQYATNLDMIRDSSRTLRFGLKPSSTDHVVCLHPIKLSERCNSEILTRYFRINCFKNISLVKLPCGLVPLISTDNAKKYITFTSVKEDWSELMKFSTLHFLDTCLGNVSVETIFDVREANEKSSEQLFTSSSRESGYESGKPIDISLKKIVLEIQDYLGRLNFYSPMLPRDGQCTKILQKCLQRFQQSEETFHRTDGICDWKTFERLKFLTSLK
uniref:VPS9 domain-containing protein n=1 Tax=Clytia hemisphaerica TaxID=252671 RepID=A0A7M5USU3_9CNID